MEECVHISAVEPQKRKKDRYNIYADGTYIASLGAEAVVTCGIKAGAQVPEAALREAVAKDNAAYALDCCAATLSHGPRTRAELHKKMRERGIDDAASEAALEKLASYGYVDDAKYAAEYVQSAMEAGNLGRIAVEYKLKEKGVSVAAIREAMAAYTGEDERAIARRQLRKLSRGGDRREERKRISAALMRHGFAYDVIASLFTEDEIED